MENHVEFYTILGFNLESYMGKPFQRRGRKAVGLKLKCYDCQAAENCLTVSVALEWFF